MVLAAEVSVYRNADRRFPTEHKTRRALIANGKVKAKIQSWGIHCLNETTDICILQQQLQSLHSCCPVCSVLPGAEGSQQESRRPMIRDQTFTQGAVQGHGIAKDGGPSALCV